MKLIKFYLQITLSILTLLLIGGCAQPPVSYEDPGSVNPLTADFGLADLNIIASKMINSLLTSPLIDGITYNFKRPIIVVDRIQNRTDEHIDTESITDTIRTSLIQSAKFRFVDGSTRQEQKSELLYQNNSGMVDSSKAIIMGQQSGAEYLMIGSIVSYQERTSKTLRRSYKFTLNLIDLKSGLIEWAQETPITKIKSKTAIGF